MWGPSDGAKLDRISRVTGAAGATKALEIRIDHEKHLGIPGKTLTTRHTHRDLVFRIRIRRTVVAG